MIRKGQIYESVQCANCGQPDCDERGDRCSIHHMVRIKVVADSFHLGRGVGKVDIVTITQSGREVRRRSINASELHTSAVTSGGKPRRTGYRLVTDTEDSA